MSGAAPCEDDDLSLVFLCESEAALHERLLRRACGARSLGSLLGAFAGELARLIPHTGLALLAAAPGDDHAHPRSVYPSDLALSWPKEDAPLSPALKALLDAQTAGVYLPPGADAPAASPMALPPGLELQMVAVLPTPPLTHLLAFVGAAAPPPDLKAVALLERLRPTLGAAVMVVDRTTAGPPNELPQTCDPVEMMDYVSPAIAHDMRNVLSGIIGAVELQRAGEGQENGVVFDAVLRRAVEGVALTDAIRCRALALSAPDAQRVSLDQLVDDFMPLLQQALVAALPGAAPRLEHGGDPVVVLADPGEVRRALTALVFNAGRYAGAAGHVTVRARLDRGRGILEVADDGPGMPEHVLRRVKQPFYTTEGGEHWGTGLAIAEGVARRYHGSMSVRPVQGAGTSVTLTFPGIEGQS